MFQKKGSKGENQEVALSRREREIMDIIFSLHSATARQIWEKMEDPPTYSTVRTILAVLEDKGHLVHETKGRTFVYAPTQKRKTVAASALQRLVKIFFEGSVEQAVSGLLESKDHKLTPEEVQRISKVIEEAKKRGGQK